MTKKNNYCCDDCLHYKECELKDEALNKYLHVKDLIHGCKYFTNKNNMGDEA